MCLESVKLQHLLKNPATEEMETYSDRSTTLPQATAKVCIGCLRKVVYICAGACVCVFL